MDLSRREIEQAAVLLSASQSCIYTDLDPETKRGMRMLVEELWKRIAPTEREASGRDREDIIAVFMAWMGDPGPRFPRRAAAQFHDKEARGPADTPRRP